MAFSDIMLACHLFFLTSASTTPWNVPFSIGDSFVPGQFLREFSFGAVCYCSTTRSLPPFVARVTVGPAPRSHPTSSCRWGGSGIYGRHPTSIPGKLNTYSRRFNWPDASALFCLAYDTCGEVACGKGWDWGTDKPTTLNEDRRLRRTRLL